jgi:ElaB/YqjD/DUF883 family membrane-anchored ribosome-binding protein
MERTFDGTQAELDSPAQDKGPMTERVDQGRQKAERLYRRTKDRATELEGKFEGYVQERPLKAMLIAAGVGAGVGLILGALVARR